MCSSEGRLWEFQVAPPMFLHQRLSAQLRSACMGSVTHNILHVPSPGVMSCIIEENLQVCF
jgi:hypothetical protein